MTSSYRFLACQVSDLHVAAPGELSYGRVDCAALLERAVKAILRLPQRPDVLLVTGDLVQNGRAAEYANLRALLAPLELPMYFVPGNHDDREAMRAAFPEHAWLRQRPPFIQYAVDKWPVRIVALDTLIPGKPGGRLCAERLAWLDATLAARPDAPTLVMLHHPPFDTLIAHMDRIGLEGREALEHVIARHAQVERVLCGHVHRRIERRFAKTMASICPSTAHQVVLDLAGDAPSGFNFEPPGFQLHAWTGQALVSHTASIGDFAGPYPFYAR